MMTRKDYIATAEILKYVSNKTHPAVFSKIVNDFAEMFAIDNERQFFPISRLSIVYSLVAIGRPSFVCCYVWNYTRTH